VASSFLDRWVFSSQISCLASRIFSPRPFDPNFIIKIAIVILGGFLAVTIAGKLSLASSLLLRGVAAIIEAYLIYWAVVYYVARKWFGFSREWAAPAGVRHLDLWRIGSDCDGKRDKIPASRPCYRVFAGCDLRGHRSFDSAVSGPGFSLERTPCRGCLDRTFSENGRCRRGCRWYHGGPILAKSAAEGVHYQIGWLLGTTAAIKVFIDVFIGIWAFILAYIWTNHINVREGDTAKAVEIWQRFRSSSLDLW